MRKRQIKKFAKMLPDIQAYRAAHGRGSKALDRRWKAFKRARRGIPVSEEAKIARAENEAIKKVWRNLKKQVAELESTILTRSQSS